MKTKCLRAYKRPGDDNETKQKRSSVGDRTGRTPQVYIPGYLDVSPPWFPPHTIELYLYINKGINLII